MAFTYFPFDDGAGADVTEAEWRDMARLWLATGVVYGELNGFAVSQDGAGTMNVDVASGIAWIRGHYFKSDATEVLPIAANGSGNPRIDLAVARADFVANLIELDTVQGTPAGSPSPPSLTQSSLAWEIPLAAIAVAAGASAIHTADITDWRVFTRDLIDYATHTTDVSTVGGATAVTGNPVGYDGTAVMLEFFVADVQPSGSITTITFKRDTTSLAAIKLGDQKGGHLVRLVDTPTQGTHTYSVFGSSSAASLLATGIAPMYLMVTKKDV